MDYRSPMENERTSWFRLEVRGLRVARLVVLLYRVVTQRQFWVVVEEDRHFRDSCIYCNCCPINILHVQIIPNFDEGHTSERELITTVTI